MTALDPTARTAFAAAHPEWGLAGESITRTFVFADFNEAMGFVTRVALAAETANHHPDIDIRWNRVTLTLSTHEAGMLTTQDTSLASTFDGWIE